MDNLNSYVVYSLFTLYSFFSLDVKSPQHYCKGNRKTEVLSIYCLVCDDERKGA